MNTHSNTTNELSSVARIFSEIMKDNEIKSREKQLKHKFNPALKLMPIRSVAVTPNNKYLIITHENTSKIKVIDLSKLEVMPFNYNAHAMTVRLVSPATDNASFYTSSWDGSFMQYSIISGKHVILFCGTRSPSVFLDPNGKYLFTAEYPDDYDNDFNIGRCWDLNKRKTVAIYEVKRKVLYPLGIDIAYDQNYAYMGCDGTMMKFNLSGKKPVLKYFDNQTGVRKIAVSEKYVAAASCDGKIRIFKKNGDYHLLIDASKYEVKDIKISNDESFIVGCSDDGYVRCWSLENAVERFSCKAHRSMIWSFCFASNENLVVSGGTDGMISFIDTETGKLILRMYNLAMDNEMLVSVPKDMNFPNGYFYTTNNEFVDVYSEEKNSKLNHLDSNDRKRQIYIDKLNCKNLVLNRIKLNSRYNTLTDHFFSKNHKEPGLKFQQRIKALGY